MFGVFAFVPQFAQSPRLTGYGFGASITQSGLILLPLSIAMFLLGTVSGRLAKRIGGKIVVLLGCLADAVALVLLTIAHGEQWELVVTMAVAGIGFGMVFSAVPILIVSAVPPEQTGAANGMNANVRTIGGSIAVALLGSIIAAVPHAHGRPVESGYTHGFATLAAALIIAALAALLIPTTRHAGSGARPAAGQSAGSSAKAGYRAGSDRGSPNQGSTLLSKRVMAQIRSPVRVRT